MNQPLCNYRGTTFGQKCGALASVQLVGINPAEERDTFHSACVDHRGELSRTYPKALFWEFA